MWTFSTNTLNGYQTINRAIGCALNNMSSRLLLVFLFSVCLLIGLVSSASSNNDVPDSSMDVPDARDEYDVQTPVQESKQLTDAQLKLLSQIHSVVPELPSYLLADDMPSSNSVEDEQKRKDYLESRTADEKKQLRLEHGEKHFEAARALSLQNQATLRKAGITPTAEIDDALSDDESTVIQPTQQPNSIPVKTRKSRHHRKQRNSVRVNVNVNQ